MFVLKGTRGGGWMSMAMIFENLVNLQSRRSSWPDRGVNGEFGSFANAVRGAERMPENLGKRKKIEIHLTFLGGETQWRHVSESMEAA